SRAVAASVLCRWAQGGLEAQPPVVCLPAALAAAQNSAQQIRSDQEDLMPLKEGSAFFQPLRKFLLG
ncbi:MAG: hypothetical protein ACK6DX_03185, partial [Acidobacteriota bacterium]